MSRNKYYDEDDMYDYDDDDEEDYPRQKPAPKPKAKAQSTQAKPSQVPSKSSGGLSKPTTKPVATISKPPTVFKPATATEDVAAKPIQPIPSSTTIVDENLPSTTNNTTIEFSDDELDNTESKPSTSLPNITVVITGHVDAGKSTMLGNLLCKLGNVAQRVIHKYRKQSTDIGKGSFALAWVMDESESERAHGVTINIAERYTH